MSIYKGTEFIAGTPDMSEYMTTTDLLSALYPVGSIYIGTQATCPLATLISGSTWELVAQNRALWGGDGTNGNTTIAAGLPNITGGIASGGNYQGLRSGTPYGAFTHTSSTGGLAGESNTNAKGFDFDASRSSSIYGSSDTVQPPAYVVNIWRRTA